MRRSRKFWLLGIVTGIAVLLVGGISLVVGTDSGTRWLLRQAQDYLPKELRIGDATGSLLHGIRFDGIEWRDESLRVSIEQLALDIELAPLFARRIAINKLDADGVNVELFETRRSDSDGSLPDIELPVGISVATASIRNLSAVGPQFARSIDSIGVAGQIVSSDLDLTELTLRSDWLRLDLTGAVMLSGDYPGNLSANWEWIQSEELRLAGELLLTGSASRYEVQHSLAAPISLTTNGFVSYKSGVLIAELLNQWEQMEWAVGERTLSSSGGTLALSGDTAQVAVELNALAQLDDVPETEITLQGEATPEGMRIAQLDLANELGQLSASGNVTWLPSPAVDINFDLSELDPSAALSGVVGSVGLRGSVKGSYADNTFTLAESVIQVGSNRAVASGSVGNDLIMDAELDLSALDELAPGTTGSLKARVNVNGPSDKPNARVNVTGQVGIGNIVLEAVEVSASGTAGAHDIRAVLESGRNKVELDAAGGYAQDGWTGTIGSLAVTNSEFGRWSNRGPAELAASPEKVALSQVCLEGSSVSANACLTFDYNDAGTATFDASIAQLPLTALPVELPRDVSIAGFIEARLRGQVNDQGLTGNATIELLDAAASAEYEGDVVSVRVAQGDSHATITENRVESTTRIELADGAGSSTLDIDIEDLADSQSAIQATGTVAVSNVSLFAVFIPGITKPHGTIDGSLTATGSLSEPEFTGEIALKEGSFGVRQAGLEIYDIDVRLQQRSTGRLQLTGSAHSGEGLVSIQGDTTLSATSGIRTEIRISGEDFELVRLPDWQVAASPSINVVLDERVALITGELAIPSASIRIDAVPETAVSASPDAIVHSSENAAALPGRRIDVNISTILGNDVQLDAFGLKTGIEGTVKIEGGSHKPYLGFGRLSLRDGRYHAYGQELKIERGELIFNGPLDNPDLDVRATRSANEVVAGIQLTGTPIQLRSTLFSEPALSDAEVLSYLLTGRPLSSATTTGEGDALNQAAFALGLSQAGSITSQIRGGLGLETLTVEGGAEDGRIVAGKRIGDRLLVEYGYGLIDKLGTLLLRYQLSNRLVLESRTGTVSNLDILYRVKKE